MIVADEGWMEVSPHQVGDGREPLVSQANSSTVMFLPQPVELFSALLDSL